MEEHPEENIQVFKQDGRTSGHGAGVTAALDEVVAETAGVVTTPLADEELASHLVQTVFVVVISMVEVETVVWKVVVPPVTWAMVLMEV